MDNRIHTVIFDLDGTLSDSAVLTVDALGRIAPKQGLPVPTEEAIRRATGYATPEFYYILFPGFPRETVYNAGLMVDEEELRILPSLSGKLLFKGCMELLRRLAEKNIRLCIASTGDREHVYSILNETGIIGFFDTIACACPDKTGMLREVIGSSEKAGCVMVGDMKKDYEAARTNGILSVGACYGYCIRELSDFDFYIDAPCDLFGILKL